VQFNLIVNKYLKDLCFSLIIIIIIIIIIKKEEEEESSSYCIMCQGVKIMWAKFFNLYIYIYTRKIYVEYPRAIFELGHCTVLIF